jgi:hypothetical protein
LPLRTPSAAVSVSADRQKTPMKEDQSKNKVSPKDFFSSIKDIEYLFIKASDSGKEVPRMLEANKLHFRPVVPGKESMASFSLLTYGVREIIFFKFVFLLSYHFLASVT